MVFSTRKKSDNPIAALEAELTSLTERRATIKTKLTKLREALQAAHNARRATLLEADLSDEQAVARRDRDCRDAECALEGVEDALNELDRRLADAQVQLDQARDRAARDAEAKELGSLIDALDTATKNFTEASHKMIQAFGPLIARVPNVAWGFSERVSTLAESLTVAADELAVMARTHVVGITAGTADICRPAPPPEPPPPVPEVERQRLFALENVKWTEPSGEIRYARQYSEILIPVSLVEGAFRKHLADRFDSERARKLIDMHGLQHGPVAPELCADIEASGAPSGIVAEAAEPSEPVSWVGAARVGEAYAR